MAMATRIWPAALLAATLSTGRGTADNEVPGSSAPARPRRTIIHFGEDDIRGDLTRPDGELVQAPRRIEEPSLLRIRRSFIDRALADAVRDR